ncbi:MAG: NYN domain-containing protein [Chloroflexi bacterium]|nr:NYN domain-containing protein [Chloroflexota bacterium]
MTIHIDGNGSAQPSSGAAIYVDTENLRDSDHAQNLVDRIVADWPWDHAPLGSLSLYVRADRVASWEMWAEAAYPDLRVRVRGVQHFTNNKAKNSADLAITADAVADLVTGQANAVAVVSNDSDFGALFVKVKELARSVGVEPTPFLWITSPEAGGLSSELERFIPQSLRWDLSESDRPSVAAEPRERAQPAPPQLPVSERPAALPAALQPESSNSQNEAIADELIRRLPVGQFKAADAHQVVRARWSDHPSAGGAARMGQFLLNELWPILQKRGVTMPRKSSPRTYEITQAAKDTLAKPTARSTPGAKPSPELTPAQLAASVTSGIPDDIFKASDAQSALKNLRPDHPAASYTTTRFGTWFAKQLWPIMEQHGVVLASEKPRRYEMTPDARHRLTALA